jgi:hypothetical protein
MTKMNWIVVAVALLVAGLALGTSRAHADSEPGAVGASCACNETMCCCAGAGQMVRMFCTNGFSK